MEFVGKIIAVGTQRQGVSQSTGKPWMNQEYVIESHERRPQQLLFEVFGEDRIKAADIKMGDELKIYINFDARQWKDRWYNSIGAWKVEHLTAQPTPTPPSAPSVPSAPEVNSQQSTNIKGDLPF